MTYDLYTRAWNKLSSTIERSTMFKVQITTALLNVSGPRMFNIIDSSKDGWKYSLVYVRFYALRTSTTSCFGVEQLNGTNENVVWSNQKWKTQDGGNIFIINPLQNLCGCGQCCKSPSRSLALRQPQGILSAASASPRRFDASVLPRPRGYMPCCLSLDFMASALSCIFCLASTQGSRHRSETRNDVAIAS